MRISQNKAIWPFAIWWSFCAKWGFYPAGMSDIGAAAVLPHK
jgi:hypothetical protein